MFQTPEGTIDPSLSQDLADHLMKKIQDWYSLRKVPPLERLVDIMNQSLLLDLAISKQIAKVQWDRFNKGIQYGFNSSTMEREPGEPQRDEAGEIILVLAPGLVRCGRASGDGFDETHRLVKSQVVTFPG